jgi:tRNA A-37 threonylcarbamoyl transferase component Bud32
MGTLEGNPVDHDQRVNSEVFLFMNRIAASALRVIGMNFMLHVILDSILDQFYRSDAPAQCDATARPKVVVGLAAGMAFMHSVGILRRDLKPQNILFDERYEIRIADFGRRCENSDAPRQLSRRCLFVRRLSVPAVRKRILFG